MIMDIVIIITFVLSIVCRLSKVIGVKYQMLVMFHHYTCPTK